MVSRRMPYCSSEGSLNVVLIMSGRTITQDTKTCRPSRVQVTVLHIHNAFIMATKDASMEIQKRGAPQCHDPTLV
jgi:hypothetical protein